MEIDDRPHLHCLVGFMSPAFGLIGEPKVMPLEDAIDYARFGFTILVDPADERDLAMYENRQRAVVRSAKRSANGL